MIKELKGGCFCGKTRFKASGDIKRVSACYCIQCQKQNGGGAFYGAEFKGELVIENEDFLIWYASSDRAKRGFCAFCGSSLFWRANDDPSYFDVSLGALDDPSDLTVSAHIFVDFCPSYISIPNTAPHLSEVDVLAAPLKES